MPFMGTGITLKGRVVIPDCDDLFEIGRKKRCNGAGLFVLVDMAKLVRQQAYVLAVTGTNENGVAQRESDHARTKKPGCDRCLPQLSIVRHWKTRYIKNSDALRVRDANTPCDGHKRFVQRPSRPQGVCRLRFRPGNGLGYQEWQCTAKIKCHYMSNALRVTCSPSALSGACAR